MHFRALPRRPVLSVPLLTALMLGPLCVHTAGGAARIDLGQAVIFAVAEAEARIDLQPLSDQPGWVRQNSK
jgi:hypothetical protein